MSRLVGTALCVQALLMCAQTAAAQIYISGALASASFGAHAVNGGSASSTFYNTSPDSSVRGVVGEIGWMLSPWGSIGVEVTVPSRRRSIAQRYTYLFGDPYQRDIRYREQTMFGVVRGRLQTGRRVRLGALGGVGLVRGNALDRVSFLDQWSNTYGPFGEERESTRLTTGLTGGVDIAIELIQRVSVVPHVRVHVIDRGDPAERKLNNLGLPTVVYRVGVGFLATF